MSQATNVAVLGAGRLAQVGGGVIARSGAKVTVWGRSEGGLETVKSMGLATTTDIGEATRAADLVIFAVPAPAIEEVANLYGEFARGDQIVLHATRGVGPGFKLPHELIRSKTCVRKIGALGGPLHSHDIALGRIMATVLASRFTETFDLLRALTQDSPLKLHTTRDLTGVEVAGAISNVSAIAAGAADALDLGDTARGLLLAHGLSEGQRLGLSLGAEPETFAGLAGVGDLIPRHVSSTDRHRRLGELLTEGRSGDEALSEIDGIVEGATNAEEAFALAQRLGIHVPLIEATAKMLAGSVEPRPALEHVLHLDLDDLIVSRSGRRARG